MENTKQNREKFVDKVVDSLISDEENIDTDLLHELLYDLLLFYYENSDPETFKNDVIGFKLNYGGDLSTKHTCIT